MSKERIGVECTIYRKRYPSMMAASRDLNTHHSSIVRHLEFGAKINPKGQRKGNQDRNAAIVAMAKEMPYSEVARKLGLSRSIVAGVVYRHKERNLTKKGATK